MKYLLIIIYHILITFRNFLGYLSYWFDELYLTIDEIAHNIANILIKKHEHEI